MATAEVALACGVVESSSLDGAVARADGEVFMDDEVDEDVGIHWLLLVSMFRRRLTLSSLNLFGWRVRLFLLWFCLKKSEISLSFFQMHF